MDSHMTTMGTSRVPQLQSWAAVALLLGSATLPAFPAHASNDQVPWECSNYSDDAQARCLNGFIEQQREQIRKLEEQVRTQQEAVGQLKGQIDRQAAATAGLQQQLSQHLPTAVVPAPYAYVYPPALGLGLYLGRPWIYGPPYYYGRPFWGPRYYGQWGRRW